MGFTTDTSTDVGKVRVLINDTDAAAPQFQDDALQVMIDLSTIEPGSPELFLAAALACDQLAVKYARASETIGTYQINTTSQTATYQNAAARYRDMANQPAFAIAEENLSSFNELVMLRNWVLRTGLDSDYPNGIIL